MTGVSPLRTTDEWPFPAGPFDARLPAYRRETFIRLYGTHVDYLNTADNDYQLKWFLLHLHLSPGQRTWLGWLGAMTCDHLTTWNLFQRYPEPDAVNVEEFSTYVTTRASELPYGIDRRYYKAPKQHLGLMLAGMRTMMGGASWEEWLGDLCLGPPADNFTRVYMSLQTVPYHGRLVPFTMSERFWNLGFPIDPGWLDVYHAGSRPFRSGLMLVLGRNDLDQRKTSPVELQRLHRDPAFLATAETELYRLYDDCRKRYPDKRHSLFHFETCLCTYKGWWRGRRYLSCYNDMMWDDMNRRWESKLLSDRHFEMFQIIRRESLPDALRCELVRGHQGYTKRRAMWFLETGELINFSRLFPDVTPDTFQEDE